MLKRFNSVIAIACCSLLATLIPACSGVGTKTSSTPTPDPTTLNGHLLVIGGGLDDDNKPVYNRLVELAKANAKSDAPLIIIASAASGNEKENIDGKVQSIRAYCPACRFDSISRDTPGERTIALIDEAHAMFFTGGDQKRITTRYLTPDGQDTPESLAMRRFLSRGGVMAGTSAGDAMMSDPMFFTGRSAEALGIRSTRTQRGPDDDADEKRREIPLGPQIGKGMGFVPWVFTDSHFFERHRFGRLVAALEQSGKGLGLGVGEDACVEIDLSTGEAIGVSVADSLLVDARGVERDGLTRRNVRARVIQQGERISLTHLGRTRPAPAPPKPAKLEEIPVVEPGQNRQLASWRFFLNAQEPGSAGFLLMLDGYQQAAWPDGRGWSVVEIEPRPTSAKARGTTRDGGKDAGTAARTARVGPVTTVAGARADSIGR